MSCIIVLCPFCTGSHVFEEGFEETLSNLKVIWFPANCTALMQPLDQGIIHSVKAHFRHRLIQFVLSVLDADGKLDNVCIHDHSFLSVLSFLLFSHRPSWIR